MPDKRVKRQHIIWEKTFANHIHNKGQVSIIYKGILQLNPKTRNTIKNGQRHLLMCLLVICMSSIYRIQKMVLNSLFIGQKYATSLSLFTFMHWRRKWQPTPVFLPGESQGRQSLVGCSLWGCTESDTTEATQQQQSNQTERGKENSSNRTYLTISTLWKVCVKVAQSCPTICDPIDCSLPGSSVHGILQVRILEWVAIPFPGGPSQPRDHTQDSHIASRLFTFLSYQGSPRILELVA